MQTYQIDDDRWMPLERAATLVREFEQVKVNAPVVYEALAAADKREPVPGRSEVRYAAFVKTAKRLAAQPQQREDASGRLRSRVTAIEGQLNHDRRRNDAAIEALQKQLDQFRRQIEGMKTFSDILIK